MSEHTSDSILITRQAIFDKNQDIYAYELLFRSSMTATEWVNITESSL